MEKKKAGNIKENSKEKILYHATKLFAMKGFEGTSIREICRAADINLCMISYYWGGKKELYRGILDDLIEKQTEYAKTFVDFNLDIFKLDKKEQIKLLYESLDKFVDFFYSKISSDLIIILLKEQQKQNCIINSPAFNFLRKLIAVVFDKPIDDREIIFKTAFIISQVNSPKILPAFTLNFLGQKEFKSDDIKIIKNNVRFYVENLLKEAKIV